MRVEVTDDEIIARLADGATFSPESGRNPRTAGQLRRVLRRVLRRDVLRTIQGDGVA